ncbi:MAG TPA: hypothetical protein VNY05_29160 [Candidatus Acidoferrales bacterium]|jgi:hypothetical protein|nr:hypothetical protein [Candidatus Acidoferrales bacterium]
MPNAPNAMPPKLPREALARLSQEALAKRVSQIAVASADHLRSDPASFLKKYPNLDFRNRK